MKAKKTVISEELDEGNEMLIETSNEVNFQEKRKDSNFDSHTLDIMARTVSIQGNIMNNESQQIDEIKIMVLWTKQALCNMAKEKNSCNISDSKNIGIMDDLVALAVQETVCLTSLCLNVI